MLCNHHWNSDHDIIIQTGYNTLVHSLGHTDSLTLNGLKEDNVEDVTAEKSPCLRYAAFLLFCTFKLTTSVTSRSA